MIWAFFYRGVMRIAHRFNWHHAPPILGIMPGNDTQLWCTWCGFRMTLPRTSTPLSVRDATTGGEK